MCLLWREIVVDTGPVERMGAYVGQEAHHYGFRSIEMDGRPFEDIVGAVVESLEL